MYSQFTAPEIFQEQMFDFKVDVYSAGVIMYHLLSQRFPFEFRKCDTDKETYEALISQELLFEDWGQHQFAEETKSLLEQILEKNPYKRLTASEALEHQVFKLARMQLYS